MEAEPSTSVDFKWPDIEKPVKKEKVKVPSIPDDYIWARGREDKAMPDGVGVDEVIDPPAGYYKLNLCAGSQQIPGHKNMNPVAGPGTDYIHPIEKYPWPFDSGSVVAINIGAYICQLIDLDDFMQECWRVLVNTGSLHVVAPYYTSMDYFRNTRNIMPITDDTFGFYCARWLKANKIEKKLTCDFEPSKRLFYYTDDWELKGDHAREWARKHCWNAVMSMEIDLKAVKPMRNL